MTKIERILEGKVVSDKADKTIVVSISTRSKTRYKGKTIKRSQKYLVHDPDNSAKEGDNVQITSSRPISKMKRWRLFKICLLYTSPSPRDWTISRMPSSA